MCCLDVDMVNRVNKQTQLVQCSLAIHVNTIC
jgi:hypothetical protein